MLCAMQKCSSVLLTCGVTIAVLMFGQVVSGQERPIIKRVPAIDTDASSGQEMFQAFCAVCHGADARGNGPAAGALNKAPSDLTQLKKNAGGKFPTLRVYDVIRGDLGITAHGSKEMPIWGRVFRSMTRSEIQTQQRLSNLTQYVESIQR